MNLNAQFMIGGMKTGAPPVINITISQKIAKSFLNFPQNMPTAAQFLVTQTNAVFKKQ